MPPYTTLTAQQYNELWRNDIDNVTNKLAEQIQKRASSPAAPPAPAPAPAAPSVPDDAASRISSASASSANMSSASGNERRIQQVLHVLSPQPTGDALSPHRSGRSRTQLQSRLDVERRKRDELEAKLARIQVPDL